MAKLALALLALLVLAGASQAFALHLDYLGNQTYWVRLNSNNNIVGSITVENSVKNKTFQDCDLFYCDLKLAVISKFQVNYSVNTEHLLKLAYRKANASSMNLTGMELLQWTNVTRWDNYSIPLYTPYNVTDANGTRTLYNLTGWNNHTDKYLERKLFPFNDSGTLAQGRTDFVLRFKRQLQDDRYDLMFNAFDTNDSKEFAWWNTTFTKKLAFTVYVNTSGETLANLPLSYSVNLSSYINDGTLLRDCSNLRLVNESEDVVLPYEVENCVGNYSRSVVHFSRPLISEGNHSFYIYLKNTSVVQDAQNTTGLWQGAGYVFVYHGAGLVDSAYGASGTVGGTAALVFEQGTLGMVATGGNYINWGINSRYSDSKKNFSIEALVSFRTANDNHFWSHGQSGASTTTVGAQGTTNLRLQSTGLSAVTTASAAYSGSTPHWQVYRNNYGKVRIESNLTTFDGDLGAAIAAGAGESLCTGSAESAGGCNSVARNESVSEIRWRNNTAQNPESNGWINAIIFSQYYDGAESESVFITLVNRTPSDLNTTNAIATGLTAYINVTNVTVWPRAWFGIGGNSSSRYADYLYVNGTATAHDMVLAPNDTVTNITAITQGVTQFVANLDDNEIYPAVYNLDQRYMESAPLLSRTLAANDYFATTLYALNNSKPYNFFEIDAQNTTIATPLRLYVCNSSYAFTPSILTSQNCAQFASITPNVTSFHSHGASMHYVVPLTISGGAISGVLISPSMSIIARGSVTGSWVVKYVSNVTRVDTTKTSANGNTWTNFTGTIDAHAHQFSPTDYYFLTFSANSTDTQYNVSITPDQFELTYQPPSGQVVTSPQELLLQSGRNQYANWTTAYNPFNYPIFYNVSLLYQNMTFVTDLAVNASSLNVTFNSSIQDVFIVRVRAYDNTTQSQYTDAFSAPFRLADYNVTFTSPFLLTGTGSYVMSVQNPFPTANANATLNFNGTDYPAVPEFAPANSTFNTTLSPLYLGNVPLFYEVTFVTGFPPSAETWNTTTFYQSVVTVSLLNCSLANPTRALVYYLMDEESLVNTSGTMQLDLQYATSPNAVVKQNYSVSVTGQNYLEVCLTNNVTFYAFGSLRYFTPTNPARENYLLFVQLSNQTMYRKVYTNSNVTVRRAEYTLYGQLGVGFAGAYMAFDRYYSGNNTFLTVAMAVTDAQGKAITYLRPNDVYHRLTVYDALGNVIIVFDSEVFSCDLTLESCAVTKNLYSTFSGSYWAYNGRAATSCNYNNGTATLSCAVVDSSGMLDSVRLEVYQSNVFNASTLYCSSSSTSPTAILTCAINNTHGNQYGYYVIADYASGDHKILYSNVLEFTPINFYGQIGAIIALLLVALAAFAGGFSPSNAVLLMGGVIVVSGILGLIALGAAAIGGLVALTIVIAWLVR